MYFTIKQHSTYYILFIFVYKNYTNERIEDISPRSKQTT